MISIRPIAFADLSGVLEMIQALSAFHDGVAEVTFDQLQRDAMGAHPWVQILAADDGTQLVGYAALLPKAKLQHGQRGIDVHHLFVAKGKRSMGIGQLLLNTSKAEALAKDCNTLFIGTDPDNTKAQRIYQEYGFTPMKGDPSQFSLSLT